jgi:hypothetical protein
MAESIGTGITKGITTVNWNLTEEERVVPMDKKLLSDYIDACALIRETEQQIRRLEHDVYEIGDIGKRWNKRK